MGEWPSKENPHSAPYNGVVMASTSRGSQTLTFFLCIDQDCRHALFPQDFYSEKNSIYHIHISQTIAGV